MCKILPNAPVQLAEPAADQQPRITVSMQTNTEFGHRKRKRSRVCSSIYEINCSTSGVISFNTLPSDDSCSQSFSYKDDQILKSHKISSEVTLSSSLDDNLDGSNLSSQLDQKRMISTDNPNFGFFPGYREENTRSLEEGKNDSNSMEFDVNDLIKPNFNEIMCSDSETQTPFEDYFDGSCMDNYTQTCDSLFFDLDLVDIETQTFWSRCIGRFYDKIVI
ncbi:hypothetical protein V9T40_007836 [Parthenolecanium corni]|uniref:Uncharacterized protein n=1 Tax=Parthenolecanium corni TaxID=536013 RepID=A0AAN9TY54_9HEMI